MWDRGPALVSLHSEKLDVMSLHVLPDSPSFVVTNRVLGQEDPIASSTLLYLLDQMNSSERSGCMTETGDSPRLKKRLLYCTLPMSPQSKRLHGNVDCTF